MLRPRKLQLHSPAPYLVLKIVKRNSLIVLYLEVYKMGHISFQNLCFKRSITYVCSLFHCLCTLLYICICRILECCSSVKNYHNDGGQGNIHLYLQQKIYIKKIICFKETFLFIPAKTPKHYYYFDYLKKNNNKNFASGKRKIVTNQCGDPNIRVNRDCWATLVLLSLYLSISFRHAIGRLQLRSLRSQF